VPCTCGVFLDSQVVSRGAALKPGEETRSIFSYAIGETIVEEIPGGLIGKKICTKKCIDEVSANSILFPFRIILTRANYRH